MAAQKKNNKKNEDLGRKTKKGKEKRREIT